MGAGEHGGFGHTYGSSAQNGSAHNSEEVNVGKSGLFSRIEYEGSVVVDGEVHDVSRRVYQRNDIDFGYVDAGTHLTNIQRMQKGLPPIGNDGKPVQLHHILQKESGPMAEVREITHTEYHTILHGLISKGNSFRNNPVLEKQYKNFRRKYWKWRAQQYLEGGNNE